MDVEVQCALSTAALSIASSAWSVVRFTTFLWKLLLVDVGEKDAGTTVIALVFLILVRSELRSTLLRLLELELLPTWGRRNGALLLLLLMVLACHIFSEVSRHSFSIGLLWKRCKSIGGDESARLRNLMLGFLLRLLLLLPLGMLLEECTVDAGEMTESSPTS
jgi:hypothetical protein